MLLQIPEEVAVSVVLWRRGGGILGVKTGALFVQDDLRLQDAGLEVGELQKDVIADFAFEMESLQPFEGAEEFQGIAGELTFQPGP